MLAARLLVSFRSTVKDQTSACGDLRSGLMPAMLGLAPGSPPCALRPPWKVGKVNPKGAVLEVPSAKMGACAVAVQHGTKFGAINPGGMPRNSSCTFALVSQLS